MLRFCCISCSRVMYVQLLTYVVNRNGFFSTWISLSCLRGDFMVLFYSLTYWESVWLSSTDLFYFLFELFYNLCSCSDERRRRLRRECHGFWEGKFWPLRTFAFDLCFMVRSSNKSSTLKFAILYLLCTSMIIIFILSCVIQLYRFFSTLSDIWCINSPHCT
jgi:hypothetical protein